MRGGGAFTEYSVESLSLPETIKDIDDEALKGVPSLKHVQVSPKNEGFSSFDDMIFTKDYSKLLLIPEGKEGAASLPDQSTLVSATAFSRCSVLSQILVGDSATYASYDGILYSKDLKTLVACPAGIGASIVIPAETETIDKDALAGCKDLASITALGNIQKIDPTAFSDETKATAVVALPAGQDYDSRKATWESAGFTNFAEPAKPGTTTNPDNNEVTTGLTYTLLDDYTLEVSWQGKDDPQANLEIPASAEINGVPYRVSAIAENAFANRGSLTSVKLPTIITTINNGAFAGCANLTTIEFPNTLRTIGERAFEATSLKDIWLPASINSIGSRAFASCSTLERIVALGTPEVASDTLAGCTNVSIYVPSGTEGTWNPGLPSDNNHLMPYGVSLSEEPLAIEAGQEADLLEGGNLQAPDPVEASYSYAAAPLSVDAGTVSAKKEGTSDVTAVLSLDNVELARASRTVEVSPNPNAGSDIDFLNADIPAIYLADARSNQISVTAPTQVILGDGNGYDVATKPECATGTAIFKNNSTGLAVQLANVECTNTGVVNNIETNDATRSLDTQSLFSLYPLGAEGAAVHFGYGNNVRTVSPVDKGAFAIAPSSSSSCVFRLNLTNDPDLADAQVMERVADNGATVRPLATVKCTFETYAEAFYLKDKATGQTFSLAQVKAHANDIALRKESSPYWSQYQRYIADDTAYICKSKWGDGTLYDIQIIGINHDVLSEPASDGRSLAGLTFQFKNVLNGDQYAMNSTTNTNDGGWGASELRARMNPGEQNPPNGKDDDRLWKLVPADLQREIVSVKKTYSTGYDNKGISVSEDKLFIAAYIEYVETVTSNWNGSAFPWFAQEGSQYEYYALKPIDNYNPNPCLKKRPQFSADNSYDYYPSYWTRSVGVNGSSYFTCIYTDGRPSVNESATGKCSICPCFCL